MQLFYRDTRNNQIKTGRRELNWVIKMKKVQSR